MKRIATIVGARPQFIKAAALSRTISRHYTGRLDEFIIHSGQHYDDAMSSVFFSELNIPEPRYNLEVGSGSHAVQTGLILERCEEVLLKEKPDLVIVYGDTNTTLAGSLAAAKIHIPVAHVEAGLRSFNRSMPEEINRIACDHVSSWLFAPTPTAVSNLLHEGLRTDDPVSPSPDHPHVFMSGDVMYDNALHFSSLVEKSSDLLERLSIKDREFVLCTLHRDHNTDRADRLNAIFGFLSAMTRDYGLTLVLPVHPRTRKMMPQLLEPKLLQSIESNPLFVLTGPLSYLEMLLAEKHARMIITDSGGVQKEAYFFQKPCLVLRAETEWVELIDQGAAVLVDTDPERFAESFRNYFDEPPSAFPAIFGDGNAAGAICEALS